MTGRAALALSSPRRDRPVLGSPPSPCPIAASLDGTPPAWAWRSSLRSVVRHAERGKLSDEMDDAQCVPAPQATVWAALNDPEPSCASAFRAASGAHDVGDRNGRLGRGPGRPGQGEVRPTLLHYVVDTRIGAKLAQLGERLIDSTAKGPAGEFFRGHGADARELSRAARRRGGSWGWKEQHGPRKHRAGGPAPSDAG